MGWSRPDDARPSRVPDAVALVALGLLILGPLLAWLRLVPAMGGFLPFALGGLLAVGVSVLALLGAVRGRRLGGVGVRAAIAGAVLFLGLAAGSAGSPRINDFTTDLTDPPRFVHAATLRANAGRDLGYPPAFADVQRACCADLAPSRLPLEPAAAFALVEATAAAMPGWTITRRDPGAGELEAVATSRIFGFHDDVIVRVRPEPAGGSRVDVRSKSRDGQGDLGANAARIRAFQAALLAAQ